MTTLLKISIHLLAFSVLAIKIILLSKGDTSLDIYHLQYNLSNILVRVDLETESSYNKLDLGNINGIPRILDTGQCNDSYSLALIALKLKEVFKLNDISELPIAFNIAWYEQKAVIVLLSLLYLGVKNIHLGPTLPAFLSKNVAKVLIENFRIGGIKKVEDDLKMFLE